MKRPPHPPPLTDAQEREWHAQERAWRDERAGSAAGEDPSLASYRIVMQALRTPVEGALPEDFARAVAARCVRAPADLRLELQVQRVLLWTLAVAAIGMLALRGGDWWQAIVDALPLLAQGSALNWTAALAACLGLSWAADAIRRASH